jgi:septum site-determining protein MinD
MGRVYAVVSAKGGVGKTTTAANLAAALAAAGPRVAVVDGDLGMANLAGALGVEVGEVTLHDVLAGDDGAPDGVAGIDAAIHEGPHGLAVVPGSPALDAFSRADPERLESVLDDLAAAYDYVVLDTGAGLSTDTVAPLTFVDEILLVSTPTRDALGDTDKTRQVAERLGVTVAGAALLRADPAAAESDAVVDSLDVGVLGTVPDAEEIRRASEAGEPLTTFAPGSPAAAAFASLAAALTGEHVAAPTADDGDAAPDAAGDADDADGTAPADGDATSDDVADLPIDSDADGEPEAASDDADGESPIEPTADATDDAAAAASGADASEGPAEPSDDPDFESDGDADADAGDVASEADAGDTDDDGPTTDDDEPTTDDDDDDAIVDDVDEDEDDAPADESPEEASPSGDAAATESVPHPESGPTGDPSETAAPESGSVVDVIDDASESPIEPVDPAAVTAGDPADDEGVYTTPLEEVPIDEAESGGDPDPESTGAAAQTPDAADRTANDDDAPDDEDDEDGGGGGFFSRFFG